MKYLIASDLHGSISAYEKLKELADEYCPDKIILLGDLCGGDVGDINNQLRKIYYPIIAVYGNCDNISAFNCLELGNKGKEYTETLDNKTLFFTHGNQYGKVIPPILGEGDAIFYGHYHYPEISVKNGVVRVCVGSLARPAFSSQKTYCLLTDHIISIIDSESGNTVTEVRF